MVYPKNWWIQSLMRKILKTLLNNKKIPCIPPLFHQGKYVTDFKKKAVCLTPFLPNNVSSYKTLVSQKTEKSISNITLNCNVFGTIVRSLDSSKAYDHDVISILTLNICEKPICKPLELIFQSSIKHGKFPNEWKMTNVVPVHKKSDEQILKNYWPVSLVPIYGKVFEHSI